MQMYRPVEFAFQASPGECNPWLVPLKVRFTGPDGAQVTLSGFYDGDACWRVRFTPTRVGGWLYETACTVVPALHGLRGEFAAAPAEGGHPIYGHGGILQVSADGRCLTHTDGTPFFWLGDTWWFCPSDAVPIDGSNRQEIPSMFRSLVDLRARQGFNVLHWAFLGTIGGTGATDFFRTRRGEAFDPAYWRTVDRYVQYANDAGLIPAIGIGWAQGFDETDVADWQHLWAYVLARYGACGVTWLVCGEYNVAIDGDRPERVAKILELGAFIKAHDPYRRAMTVHPWWHAGDKRQAWTEPWYDFTMFQSAHLGNGETSPASLYGDGWRQARPMIEGETNYEGILKDCPVTADAVRLSAYFAMQHGCAGFTYGAHGLWYPTRDAEDRTFDNWGDPVPWWQAAARPGAEQMGILRRCYASLPWWRTAPWPEALVVDGLADGARPPLARGALNPAAVLIYFPATLAPETPVMLRPPGALPATLIAEWWNPRTGDITAAECVTADTCMLPPRPGALDWVLILREQAA